MPNSRANNDLGVRMPINAATLRFHAGELLFTLEHAFREDLCTTELPQGHPTRWATLLFLIVQDLKKIPTKLDCHGGANHAIRQLHDFYGWKAKDTVLQRGVCSGALYRSSGYLRLAPESRCGAKDPERRSVHIEHTVPASCLEKVIHHYRPSIRSPQALHDFLISYSISAAFTHDEERLMQKQYANVPGKRTSCFDETGAEVEDRPFARYKRLARYEPEFRIYSMLTLEPIDLENFTFRDHRNHLRGMALKLSGRLGKVAPMYCADLFQDRMWRHYAEIGGID